MDIYINYIKKLYKNLLLLTLILNFSANCQVFVLKIIRKIELCSRLLAYSINLLTKIYCKNISHKKHIISTIINHLSV